MNWDEVRDSALDAEAIKQRLSAVFVLDQYNIPVYADGGKVTALCPFHDDTDPSFDVYSINGIARVGCFPCNKQGDVIDLIQWLDNCNFSIAMTRATELLKQQESSNYETPKLAHKKPAMDPEVVADTIFEALQEEPTALIEMIQKRNWPVEPEWLQETFFVGCRGSDVLIPYQDNNGVWTGYKIRNGKEKRAGTGSRFSDLYAQWLDKGRSSVVVCEGEPDTWAAYAAVGDRHDVLGLPTGAGSKVREDEFRNRHVILAFDGDHAGREGTRRWVAGLANIAASIRVVPMPDGYDICMLPDIARSIEEAKPILQYTGSVELINGLFMRISGEKKEFLTNWGFEPIKELINPDGGIAYEGYVLPTKKMTVITSDDLSSSAKTHSWAQNEGLGWRGTEKDAHDILIWLESQGPFLAPGKMTRVLGLHDGHFVLPNTTIGKDRWVYVGRPGIVHKYLDFEQRSGWQPVLYDLLQLHQSKVVHPILAWLAVAPVRSLLDEFPILAISGSSGAGKTTLLKTMLQSFSGGAIGGKDGISLADTTKHAITENVGATNAVPVWFDEYRASIKSDTRDALHNSLLAAYIGQTTSKGSVTDRGLGVTNWEHDAPIVISGENTFAETAHVERMIQVSIPQDGRNSKALARIQDRLPSGLAEAYIRWLIYRVELDELQVKTALYQGLPSRVNMNLGVLKLGWSLLGEFMFEYRMGELPEPDFSLVVAEATEAANDDPVLEAIRWAVESQGSLQEMVAIVRGDKALIRVESLVSMCNKDRRFPLPGNAKAIRRLLLERYNGEDIRERIPSYGFQNPTRFVTLDMDVING